MDSWVFKITREWSFWGMFFPDIKGAVIFHTRDFSECGREKKEAGLLSAMLGDNKAVYFSGTITPDGGLQVYDFPITDQDW